MTPASFFFVECPTMLNGNRSYGTYTSHGTVVGLLAVLIAASSLAAVAPGPDFVAAGTGGYVTALPAGAKAPPAEIYRTANAPGPMPTNDWWSSLAWLKFSERMYAHPLAV